jgi:hypothetical protein
MANPVSEVTPLDHRILMAGGVTTGVERLRGQLQQAKHHRQGNLLKQNLDLIRENGRLRKEIAYHEERTKPLLLFYEKYLEMHHKLQSMAQTVAQQMGDCESELLQNLGIRSTASHMEDVNEF